MLPLDWIIPLGCFDTMSDTGSATHTVDLKHMENLVPDSLESLLKGYAKVRGN